MNNMHWEYKVVELNTKTEGMFSSKTNNTLIEQSLNDMSHQGWELISCHIGIPSPSSAISNYTVPERAR